MAKTSNNSASHFKTSDTNTPKRSFKKPLLIGLGTIAGVWAIGTGVFSFVFMPYTTFNGSNVSLTPKTTLAAHLSDKLKDYSCTLKDGSNAKTITSDSIGLTYDSSAIATSAISETKPYLWPVQMFKHKDISNAATPSYDKDKLAAQIKEFIEPSQESPEAPQDAKLVYNEESKNFDIEPAHPGSAFNEEACIQKTTDAITKLQTEAELDGTCKEQAALQADDARLKDAQTEANGLLSNSIMLKLGSVDAFKVDAEHIAQWITIDDQAKITINEQAIKDWFNKDIAPKFNTVGTKRTYERPDGKSITVAGGTYGWKVDTSKVADKLADQILNKKGDAIEIPVAKKAASFDGLGKKDWGSTWIDIDLSEQYARFYKNGEVAWESKIVSGNQSEGHHTPMGVWSLNKKQRNVTLLGKMDPETKEREYETPVKYWMPFIGNSVGLHDANWRSTFGGNIYKWGGSHGCINLPPSKAESLFSMIPDHVPVITHA